LSRGIATSRDGSVGELEKALGAAENFHRKGVCVEYAVIHRCPGDRVPFAP
jgi:hypothetical protein